VEFPIENGGSFHSYVSLPEGNQPLWEDHLCSPANQELFSQLSQSERAAMLSTLASAK